MMTAVFVLYLVLLLVIGAVASRHGRSMEGYFLANRGLGSWVTAISATASSESGWLVVGLVGEAYLWGAKAVWTAHGCLLGFLVNWYLVAPRMRRQSLSLAAITVPDFLAERLGDSRNIVRLTGVAVILLSLCGYVAAQFTAAGKAFQGAFGISYETGVLIGAAITIFYTLVGGFRAVSWTDLAQGLLMVLGLVLLPIATVNHVGGPTHLFDSLRSVAPRTVGVFDVTRGGDREQIGVEETPLTLHDDGLVMVRDDSGEDERFLVDGPVYTLNGEGHTGTTTLEPGDVIAVGGTSIRFTKTTDMLGGDALADPFGGEVGAALLGWIIGLLGIGLGYPGQPHILTRFMAAGSGRTIRRAQLIAMVWGVLVLYGAVLLGHAARLALPDLIDPELAYPTLAVELLPPVLAGVLLAAIVSAMMSTADSQLLVISSAVARDIMEKSVLKSKGANLGWISRGAVLVLGLAALVAAFTEVRVVFWFVLFAWAGLGSAFGPPVLFALFWSGTSRAGVLAGMIGGFATTILWKLWLKDVVAQATGLSLYELVPAFAVSMVLTWAVSVAVPPTDVERRRAADLLRATPD